MFIVGYFGRGNDVFSAVRPLCKRNDIVKCHDFFLFPSTFAAFVMLAQCVRIFKWILPSFFHVTFFVCSLFVFTRNESALKIICAIQTFKHSASLCVNYHKYFYCCFWYMPLLFALSCAFYFSTILTERWMYHLTFSFASSSFVVFVALGNVCSDGEWAQMFGIFMCITLHLKIEL